MNTVPQSAPPIVTRPFLLLVAAHLLQGVGWSSMMLLPRYLEYLGASRTTIGTIMAAEAISGLLARPVVGWALDRVGRKPTLIAATILVVAGMVLIGFTNEIGPLIVVSRLVFGAGVGALFTAYFAFAADIVPTSRRTEGIALFGVSGLIPLVVNPLSEVIGIAAPDLRWFFPVLAAVVATSLIPLLLISEEKQHVDIVRPTLRETITAVSRRRLWPTWTATIAFAGLVSLFMAFSTVAADGRGIANPTSFWFTYAMGAVVVRLFGARLPDRLGTANMVAPAIAIYVLAALALAAAETTGGLLLAGLLAGVGHGYAFPVLASQVVSRAPASVRGSALATFTGLWSASSLVLSPLFGALSDRHDDATMFAAAAIFAISALVVWLWFEHRHGADLPD